jgi:PAS domain S-box-containing protein
MTNLATAFYAFADFLPVGTFLSDLEGRYKYVNPFYCRMLEAPQEALLGEGWLALVHPDDRARVREEMTGQRECRFRFQLSTGKTLWVACRLVPRPDDCGKGYVGTVIDHTQRMAAEAAARESTQRMRVVLDNTPLAIVSLDGDGRVTSWSRGAERMFGWREQETLGRIPPQVTPDGLEEYQAMIRRVRLGGQYHSEVCQRRKRDGSLVRVRVSARRLDAGNGEDEIVMVADDITDRERLAAEWRELVDQRERFAADLHDGCIQSLLAVGFALRACAESVADEAPAEAATRILQASSAVTDLAGELRDQFLNEAAPPSAPWDLDSAVQRIIVLHAATVPEVSAKIDSDVARSLQADRLMHLVHILREATSNMARHSGATSGRITLSAKGEWIRLEVADDGIGFVPEARQGKGRGLGHIADRARKLQGSARFVSERGRGTRVVVEIPREPAAVPAE